MDIYMAGLIKQKGAVELHYGKCRIQCFLLGIRIQEIKRLFCINFDHFFLSVSLKGT